MKENKKNLILCPKCRHEFSVDEVFSKNIEEKISQEMAEKEAKLKQEYETQYAKKAESFAKEKDNFAKERALLLKEKENLNDKVAQELKKQLDVEKDLLKKKIEQEKSEEFNLMQKELDEQNQKNNELKKQAVELKKLELEHSKMKSEFETKMQAKLMEQEAKRAEEIQKHELALKKMQFEQSQSESKLKQELEEKLLEEKRNAQAELEKRLQDEKEKMQKEITERTIEQLKHENEIRHRDELEKREQEWQQKLKQKETQLEAAMTKSMDLQKRLEQGSMQIQGESQELIIEEFLRSTFPLDQIEKEKSGQKGADVYMTVMDKFTEAGLIVIESKNTKNFDKKWVPKLRDDSARANGSIAILVTKTLPKEIDHAGMIDDVWVCEYSSFKYLIHALRDSLLKVNRIKMVNSGRTEKTDLLYQYITSDEFTVRLQGMLDGFISIKANIDSERIAMEKIWSKREQELRKAIIHTNALRGSLEGIIGDNMGELPGSPDLFSLGD